MPTANNFKPILHRKQWAMCATPLSGAISGSSCVKNRLQDQLVYWFRGQSNLDLYNPNQDAWANMPPPGAGTFSAGACTEASAIGPSGTATAGSSTTLTTNLTLPIDLRGYTIRITGGPGAGDVRTIASNTLGVNSVITVTSPFSTPITSSSTYTLLTGRVYLFGGGTLGGSSFRVFDYALQTYSSLSVTGLPATFGSDGFLFATPSIVDLGEVNSYATGTATAGGATTITNAAKNWTTNQWSNAYQVRITGGTGAGQVRRIASNTATVLTVTSAWTTNPDATSVYSIEGDDDSLYLIGNSAVTMYRYSISGNSWATISPSVARGGVAGQGCLSALVTRNPASDWTNENDIRNGRRIYSFRGGSSAVLDYFDIATNSWVNSVSYGPISITPASGWKCVDSKGRWFIKNTATSSLTGLWYVFDFATHQILPWNSVNIFANQSVVGNTPFIAEYVDGGTSVPFLYSMNDLSTFTGMMRTYIGYNT